MPCGIYKITNKISGKAYIGQSIDIQTRWNNEKSKAFLPSSQAYNKTLSKAFRKYGLDNFTFEILEECDIDLLDEREIYYIALYDTYFNGYNETTGGNNGNMNYCQKISKEQLLEIYDLLQHSDIPQTEIANKYGVGNDIISTINHGKSRRLKGYTYPLRDNSSKYYCCDCGAKISQGAIRCNKCQKIHIRKVDRPDRDILKQEIRNTPFTQLGKKYNVSDKCIVKWCEYYKLPAKKSIIKTYSDDDWELI